VNKPGDLFGVERSVKGRVLIGGDWYEKSATMESIDPATGEVIGSVPVCSAQDVEMAIEAARRAQGRWASLSVRDRFARFEVLKGLIIQDSDALASLITQENGKPLMEAHSVDLAGGLDFLGGLLKGGATYLEDRRVRASNPAMWGKSHTLRRVPLGVVGVISPWNLPFAIPMGQILAALAAGNTVVFKPSELTPLVGVKIATLFHRAAFPPGVFNLVTGGAETGAALVAGQVDAVLFTGSSAVGRKIQEALAPRMVPSEMELGGKDPFLVLEDAHYERTVAGAVWSGCFGTGQACSSAERYFVPRSWSERFARDVADRVRSLKVGPGIEDGVQIGPLVSEAQRRRVESQVNEAVERGARLLCGGKRMAGRGFFYEPTVLADVPLDCALMREETFGPLIPIRAYDSLEEAIGWCNDSNFGLSASIWTSDTAKGAEIARRLEVGTVWINDSSYTHGQAQCPWGGMKGSGRGRTHWLGSLHELTAPQVVAVDSGKRPSEWWWYPYTPAGMNLFRRYRIFMQEGLWGKVAHLGPMIRNAIRFKGQR
jgi:acyl-CoA reductase-like NAD-dependent aldehyde dehydrogenase